jgi:calpain-15
LSILSALAEQPSRITNLFITDRTNEFGIYAVKQWKNGELREVVVDDYVPCSFGEPCFSKANGNELWVIILEKVWAKLHGSYERIEAGHAHNVMTDLTGAPAFDIDIEEYGVDALWTYLVTSEKKNYLMAASAGTTDASAEVLEELGLVAQHSYGLLKACEITDAFGE